MNRRGWLRAAGLAGTAALAGCLDAVTDVAGLGDDVETEGPTVLDPPETEVGEPIHPTYGELLPSFDVPAPLSDETITEETFRGERATMLTFFYSNCPDGVCPALLQRLVEAQYAARDAGRSDEVALLPITFDPERDTTAVLEGLRDRYGVDETAGNWHFLRPETAEAADERVVETFGLPIERTDPEEHDHGGEQGAAGDGTTGSDGDGPADEETGGQTDDHAETDADADTGADSDSDADAAADGGEYTFTHYELILLANQEGVVERSYPQATGVPPSEITEDLLTVLEGDP